MKKGTRECTAGRHAWKHRGPASVLAAGLLALVVSSASAAPENQPVRTALLATGEEFRATGTLVPAAIAEQPQDGLALATATGQLTLVPSGVEAGAGAGIMAGPGAAVLFPAVGRHADAIVRPRPDGIETFATLRHPKAPGSFTWDVSLEGGMQLVPTEGGAVQILDPTPATESHEPASEALRAEDVAAQASFALRPTVAPLGPGPEEPLPGAWQLIAQISPPVSVDAKGRSVPTGLEVRGSELTMRVDTARAAFPIVAGYSIQVRPYRVVTVEDVDIVAGGRCKRSFQRRVFESLLGTDLGWVRLKKHFCWDRGRRRVTYAEAVLEYDTTGAGSVAQWDVDGVTSRNESYFPWRGHFQGGHRSLAAVRFKQSALGWGLDSETVRTEIRAHADGSVSKP